MNWNRLGSLALAILCLAALGVAATTLESSLETEPDEEIDPDWDRLPIGQGDAQAVVDEIEANRGDDRSPGGPSDDDGSDGSTDGGEDDAERPPDEGEGEDKGERPPDEGEDEAEGSSDSGDREADVESERPQEGEIEDESTGTTPGEPFEPLFWLVRNATRDLLLLVLFLALLALSRRYSDRLSSLAAWTAGRPTTDAADGWPPGDPSNEVDRAWLEMVRNVDIDEPDSKTTADCARAAVEAGMNPDAVRSLTRLFEEIHYGGAPVTDERRRRARRELRRLEFGKKY